jgi:triacylglycerol esterase/lipase EstA (alpha/beta hydrolase family)
MAAERLGSHIEAAFGLETPVDLLGFSMGGVIARTWVQLLGGAAHPAPDQRRQPAAGHSHNPALAGRHLRRRQGCGLGLLWWGSTAARDSADQQSSSKGRGKRPDTQTRREWPDGGAFDERSLHRRFMKF